MKIVKYIVLVIVSLLVILLLVGLFTQKEYNILREVTINKPEAEVFDYIKHIKNQDYYSKWNMADPKKKTNYTGEDGTVGFIYSWDGNSDVGAGEQEITKIIENERIDMALRFKRPFENNANTFMSTEAIDATTTKVTWAMYGNSTYPFNAMNFIMDGTLGEDLSASLINLKTILEKQ